MNEKLHSANVAGFTAFAAPISAATAGVNEFGARLTTHPNAADMTALHTAKLSWSAAQRGLSYQHLTTYCQWADSTSFSRSAFSSSLLDRVQQVFVSGTILPASTAVLMKAVNWIWAIGIPLERWVAVARGQILTSLSRAVRTSESLIAMAGTAKELVAGLATLAGNPVIVPTATAALVAAVSHSIWRNRSAMVKIIRRLASAVSGETASMIGELVSVMIGPEEGSKGDLELARNGVSRRATSGRLNGPGSSRLIPWSPPVLALLNKPGVWGDSPSRPATLRTAAAIAMLSTQLLAAPAIASIVPSQPGPNTVGADALTINSTPTIVINACQPDDIENRVKAALEEHREAIYTQWSRELQRRQRTEF
jgi:hypothetical protein